MGIGDALMASGQARLLNKETKLPVLIVGRYNVRYWSEMWDGVDYIIRRPAGRRYITVMNGPGVRPYIADKTPDRWRWKPFTPTPAEIVFTPAELAFAEPYRGMVMVEPNCKDIGHTNKQWGTDKWAELLRRVGGPLGNDVQTIVCVPRDPDRYVGCSAVAVTPTFRHAAAVLSVCKAFVGGEGGLMHAAAAVGTPAVITYGGFIAPEVTGYKMHRNLFTGEGLGCGMRTDCKHCRQCMDAISVDDVVNNLKEIL